MANAKWTWFRNRLPDHLSLCGRANDQPDWWLIFGGATFGVWTMVAFLLLAGMLFLLFRPNPQKRTRRAREKAAV
jgi:ferrous iron transport protein B